MCLDGNDFALLIRFKNKFDKVSKKNLMHNGIFSEGYINKCIEKGYIEEVSCTDIGEPQFCITDLGIKERDKKKY